MSILNNEFIQKIRIELIEKSYYNDLKYNLTSKSRWKLVGDASETLAYLCMGFTGIFAFSAGFFDHKILSFVAGCLSIAAPLLLKFSSRAMLESKERTIQVNCILRALGIDTIPDISIDSTLPPKEQFEQQLDVSSFNSNMPANNDVIIDINRAIVKYDDVV